MDHEKSFGYTLLLGVCMIISLILIGKMLLYHAAPIHTPKISQVQDERPQEDKREESMWLSETEIAAMIEEHLPEDFPVKGFRITVSRDGAVRAQGTLYKDKLAGYLDSGSPMRSALTLLPAQFALDAEFNALCEADGRLILTPDCITAGGLQIPASVMTPALNTLNEAVNQALQEKYPGYRTLHLADGALELEQ